MDPVLTIGGISIAFSCPSERWRRLLRNRYRHFLTPGRRALSVVIDGRHPAPAQGLSVTGDAKGWRIIRHDFNSLSSKGLTTTTVRCDFNRYSFDSWLRIFFSLCGLRRPGFLLHASGVTFGARAYLFPGISGTGKSTMIRILGKGNAFSDELVFVYRRRGRLFAAATPFWGELKKGSRALPDAPLRRCIFLHHGRDLGITKAQVTEALPRLLKTVLFFSTAPREMRRILSLAGQLAVNVPSRHLTFAKTSKAPEIRALMGGNT